MVRFDPFLYSLTTFLKFLSLNICNSQKNIVEVGMRELSKAEEIILLAVWRVGKDAYGVNVRKHIEEDSGKDYTGPRVQKLPTRNL